jgi:hypothetical protein
MKRRKFLWIGSAVVLAVASVPAYRYYKKKSKFYNPLVTPNDLSRFCDEGIIRDIGLSYRTMTPVENEKRKLTDLLLTSDEGKITAESDNEAVFELIDKKVRKDFKEDKLQVIKGWVISTTEARQCALFSLT